MSARAKPKEVKIPSNSFYVTIEGVKYYYSFAINKQGYFINKLLDVFIHNDLKGWEKQKKQ